MNLFGVSEPELTEKPPFTNPKNHKLLRLTPLYTIRTLMYIGLMNIFEPFIQVQSKKQVF